MNGFVRWGLGTAVLGLVASALTACATPLPAGDGVVVITTDVSPQLAEALDAALATWSKTSGIEVSVDVVDEVNAESAGDIGLWTSVPALMAAHSEENPRDIAQLTAGEGEPWTTRSLPGLSAPVMTADGVVVGVPFALGVDTLVYSNPQAFAEHGYTLPETGAEIKALAESVTTDQTGFPWCAGVENGADSGAQFAKWLDHAILNTAGPEAYGQWRRGELAPDAPAVVRAVTALEESVLNDTAVGGGRTGVALNGYANTAPLFEKAWRVNGQCVMYLGDSEIATNFPEAVVTQVLSGDDSRLSVIPYMMGEDDSYSLVATGSYFGAIALDEDVVAVLAYVTTPEFVAAMAKTPGYLSPWASDTVVEYGDPVTTSIGGILQGADTIELSRFSFVTPTVREEFLAIIMEYLSGDADWASVAGK
jgi:alpha-glucoside transport system substrate-binding protein